MTIELCDSCGRAVPDHDRHVRFSLPDPVFDTPEREGAPGVWMTGETPREADLLQVPHLGTFVRALLPIRLSEGHTLTYGVWLAVHPDDFPAIVERWWAPDYADLRVSGWLANAIKPWGMLAAPVEATVRDPGETPYCERSDDERLARVLSGEWPHELVLEGM